METTKPKARLCPTFSLPNQAMDCRAEDNSFNKRSEKSHRPSSLSILHSSPNGASCSSSGVSSMESTEDAGIYGPVGSREASVNWFKATQAKDLISEPEAPEINSTYAEWFHGIITRKESERLLERHDVGCFLVRLGESRLGYTLSFKDITRCRHYMVDYLEEKQVYHVLGESVEHRSLSDLIKYHQQNPLKNWTGVLTKACPQEAGQCDYLELMISPQDEKMLENLWSRPRLEATAPMYESTRPCIPAGGEYGISLTQLTTAHPQSVTTALNQLLLKTNRQMIEENRYTAEPFRSLQESAVRVEARPELAARGPQVGARPESTTRGPEVELRSASIAKGPPVEARPELAPRVPRAEPQFGSSHISSCGEQDQHLERYEYIDIRDGRPAQREKKGKNKEEKNKEKQKETKEAAQHMTEEFKLSDSAANGSPASNNKTMCKNNNNNSSSNSNVIKSESPTVSEDKRKSRPLPSIPA